MEKYEKHMNGIFGDLCFFYDLFMICLWFVYDFLYFSLIFRRNFWKSLIFHWFSSSFFWNPWFFEWFESIFWIFPPVVKADAPELTESPEMVAAMTVQLMTAKTETDALVEAIKEVSNSVENEEGQEGTSKLIKVMLLGLRALGISWNFLEIIKNHK